MTPPPRPSRSRKHEPAATSAAGSVIDLLTRGSQGASAAVTSTNTSQSDSASTTQPLRTSTHITRQTAGLHAQATATGPDSLFLRRPSGGAKPAGKAANVPVSSIAQSPVRQPSHVPSSAQGENTPSTVPGFNVPALDAPAAHDRAHSELEVRKITSAQVCCTIFFLQYLSTRL
jgi:hypothetical protein